MAKRWLVINIGCLGCRNPTNIEGTFDTYAQALEATIIRPGDPDPIYGQPQGVLLSDMKDHDWRGSGITLICDLGD